MENSLPRKDLLRPDEVAAYYGVTVSTVRGWIRMGKLEAVEIAGHLKRIPYQNALGLQKPTID
ncbi:MAG: excisionase family DNA-binding protein [Desulfuromonadaceae bacterium]